MNAAALTGALMLPESLRGVDFTPAPKKDAIGKIRYSHDAMIDMIVANPWVSQGELAMAFGYTEGWVSQVICSDVFQARLADRKDQIVDPTLRASIEDNFKSLAKRSFEILMRKLDEPLKTISDETALKALEIAAKAMGYGQKGAGVQVNNNFVVQVPAKAASSAAWANQHGAGGLPVTSPPAIQAPKEVQDAVLVASGSTAPIQSLLDELKAS